jgi:hypothetical protein
LTFKNFSVNFPLGERVKKYFPVFITVWWLLVIVGGASLHASNTLFVIIAKGKYGFIDKTGKIVIEHQFNYVGSFSEGLAVAKIGDKYGLY